MSTGRILIVSNCAAGDYLAFGGGLCSCKGLVENNTIAGNSANEAAGLVSCTGTIRNCIIWENVALRGEQIGGSSTPSYSCIQFWDGDGEGNLDYNPHFVDAAGGDYHLLSWSPCIDSGDPASPFSMEPEPNGGRIDMGAYGNTPEATSKSPDADADGLPDEWERAVFGDLLHDGQGDPDDDRCVNLQEYHRGTSPTGTDLWYVDGNVPASGEGRTWATAFRTIQEGIDAASDDETVIVAQGAYFENIEFKGKNITLQSTDPLDAGVVEQTVIDGSAAGSVVVFSATESPACVLSGFTIRNGEATSAGGICGGGINDHTRATVRCNLIANTRGGGIAFCDGLIENNKILGNRSGLHDCDGVIRHNLISGNGVAWGGLGVGGGGLNYCDGTIQSNAITDNCTGAYGGGGLYECDGTIIGNLIAGNSANRGGGLALCSGFIANNTVVGNVAVESGTFYGEGGGLCGCNGTIRNCIIWGNVAKTGTELESSSVPAYSCVRFWSGGGVGNTAHYPYFVDAGKGDYHLKSWSPCIDAGDPASPFSLEPQPNGARIDMGTYGNTPEATPKSPDSDHDGLPDDWEMHFFSDLLQDANGDVDGDGLSNAEEYDQGSNPSGRPAWYVDASASSPGDGKTWETAFETIQEGIEAALDGDIVMVAEGIYYENIVFNGNNVTLTSVDPLHSPVVAGTIMDGGQSGSVVTFLGTEDPVCVVAGFTIRNGSADPGGGIHGFRTHATIEHNLITENSAYRGGGLAYCDGVIRRNTISGNTASGLAPKGVGAGLYRCSGTVQGNLICRNAAVESGGGLYDCDGAVRNNLIIENAGGIAGLSLCDGTIENNTVANNVGGGISSTTGTIRNCIVWGNAGPDDQDVYSKVDPTYSCIQRWSGGGEGNTHHYPYFVDAGNGDYHLRTSSPCIDAGDPSSPFSQEPEPNGGRVNMGAYGNTQEATSKSPDADQDGLPDDWETEHFGTLVQGPNEDPDADGIPNLREYYRGFDPNLPATSWHVDGAVTISGDGRSWATAFKTVQEGIDAASHGDSVVVAAGTYAETIDLRGKNIFLRSTDPLSPTVVASTILTAGTGPSIVTFAGTEDENCVVEGFTIQNGSATWGGGIFGGSMDYPTHATIQNNVITNNSAYEGGGIAYCDGLIQHNIIKENSPGGLWYCDGVIRHNRIAENTANGLSRCNGIIENNRIESNLGTAITGCIATIRNNVICDHLGAGLSYCDGTIENNTICDNAGYGLEECSGIIRNCIVWGNPIRLSEGTVPTYSCIEGWMEGGLGNINYYPHFVDVNSGDYHLSTWSPCIDTGDPASPFSQEPQPNGSRVDMGAYGNTPEATPKS
ncbi:MAG: right-handed parallel beta-helix repeat-containing protein [bacterium]|nr:right-handed parallel beta-helix repeat-containing protein [bacterium]